jgi:hypothetical protein
LISTNQKDPELSTCLTKFKKHQQTSSVYYPEGFLWEKQAEYFVEPNLGRSMAIFEALAQTWSSNIPNIRLPSEFFKVGSTSITIGVEEVLNRIKSIKKVEIKDEISVREFLQANPDVLNVLEEAIEVVDSIFNSEGKLLIELVEDPEIESKTLFLYISTNLDVEESLKLLDRIDKEWLLAKLPELSGKFMIDVI